MKPTEIQRVHFLRTWHQICFVCALLHHWSTLHTATSTKYSSSASVTWTEGQTETVWIGEVTCDLENTLNFAEACDRLKDFKSMACPNKCSNDLGYGLTFEIHIK